MARDFSHIDDHLDQHMQHESDPEEGLVSSQGLTNALTLSVKLLGAGLMIVGLIISLLVINEAWSLYRDPTLIEPMVQAIEEHSNLNKVLASVATDETDAPSTGAQLRNFRLAYFPAWFIAIVMLLLIGRLSIAAIQTGGELALYDRNIRKLARTLLREAGNRSNS